MTPREVAEFWQPVFPDRIDPDDIVMSDFFLAHREESADLILQAHAGRMLAEAGHCVVRDDDGDWWGIKTATGVDWRLSNAPDYRHALRDAAAMLVDNKEEAS